MGNLAKILIIDDDPDIVESMRVVLESKKYLVASAKNGEEGLKKAKADKPSLIILDVMMESSDKGFEVARQIKSDKVLKDVPIIMLTAIAEKMGLDFKNEAGDPDWLPVDDYCDKPLNPEQLISKVELFIGNK
jgi:two-component system, OmpR family, alkaline phosphatase synthesis response regulator PhoP